MEARAVRDFDRADDLKRRIEAAGWRVVDHGKRSSVHPAAPGSVDVAGERRYGSTTDVPSAWDGPAASPFTIVVVASEEPARVSRLLGALRAHAAAGTQVVIVENDPSDAQLAALAAGAADRAPIGGVEPEVLRTSVRLAHAAALNIGLRRAAGEIVVLADGSAVPTGDALSPLAEALRDPDVALSGGFGLLADEGMPFRPNAVERATPEPNADLEVAALEAAWLGFRRADLIEFALVDERFVTPAWLDVWLSLRLRVGPVELPGGERDGVEGDEAETEPESDGPAGTDGQAFELPELPAPKRALMIDLPLERDETRWPPDRTRLNRRNMYRVLDTFGWRDDLA